MLSPADGREDGHPFSTHQGGVEITPDAVDEDQFVAVSELFPETSRQNKPGRILAGARGKEGLTQKQLAEKCAIPQGHISEMEQGRRPIGLRSAKALGSALNIGYKVFL